MTGFSGAYGKLGRTLNAGDKITVKVWNAQAGAGPAVMTREIGEALNEPARLSHKPTRELLTSDYFDTLRLVPPCGTPVILLRDALEAISGPEVLFGEICLKRSQLG